MAPVGSDMCDAHEKYRIQSSPEPQYLQNRRRRSTGGAADANGPPVASSYAQAAHMRYQLNLSVDEKPDRITNKTGCAKALHVTEYAFRKDFPAAIRAARVELWEDLKHAKSQHFLA